MSDRHGKPPRLSPIEQQFWDAWHRLLPGTGLITQQRVLRYRLDFALPEHKVGIELDGHATHSSTTAIAADRKRQREIEAAGWRVIRFGGQEVHRDAEGCVRQAAKLLGQLQASFRLAAWRRLNCHPYVLHDPYAGTCPPDPRDCLSHVGCGRCVS